MSLKFTLEVDGPVTTLWQARTARGNLVEVSRDNLSGKHSYALTSMVGYRLTGGHVGTYDEAVRMGEERARFYDM